MKEEQLVFIISQPRAGSTLLQSLLSNHELIYSKGESWLLLPLMYSLKKECDFPFEDNYSKLAIHEQLEIGGLSSNDLDHELKDSVLNIYTKILENHHKTIFLDKTPRYYYIIPELIKVFPNAKFIYLVRNPLAVFSSILTTWLPRIIEHKEDIFYAPKLISENLGNNGLVVHYEDMIKNSALVMKKICDYLNIEFNDEILILNESRKELIFGDPTGKLRFKKIESRNHSNYLDKAKKSYQHWRLLMDYCITLPNELLTKLGYSKDELIEGLDSIKPRPSKAMTLEILFNGNARWNLKYLLEEFYIKYGKIKGSLLFFKAILFKVLKFERPDLDSVYLLIKKYKYY